MTTAEPTSLLRREAAERAALVSVQQMNVGLDLSAPGDHFASVTTIEFKCVEPGAATFCDFAGVELVEATLNGQPLAPQTWSGRRIPLPGLAASNTLVVRGQMAYSNDGEALHRHVDPADQQTYLYAMSFLDAGPRWFACFDQPDLKSPYSFDVVAPATWVVAGNGPAVAQPARPDDHDHDHDAEETTRWRIVQPRPLSTYVVTLVAGPYATLATEHDGIPLVLHAPASLAAQLSEQAADIFTVTGQAFDYYHRVFGVRYPFGEYHQAFVPDFNAGAMENPGCVTLRAEYVHRGRATETERATRAGVIAHELAHQWFGDLVTMRWWDDLWLNESFADYLSHRACAEATRYDLWTQFGVADKDWGYVADQSPSTHAVAGNGVADAASALADFDGISYAKGAALLRQLAGLVGDDVFFSGLHAYFQTHAYGNATLADLMAAWTRAGAERLDEWATGWLQTPGVDTLAAEVVDGGVVLVRYPSTTHPARRTHAVTLAALDQRGAELARTAAVVVDRTDPWEPPVGTRLIVPDADDETWAKIRFADGWAPLTPLVVAIEHPATRVVVANSVRDGVRDAELDTEIALTLLLDLVAGDHSDETVSRLLAFAQDVVAEQFSPPSSRAARRGQVQAVACDLLAAATPGSDRQLTAFRAAVRSADDAELLGSWVDGSALPAGLELDPDLRWSLVTRLSGRTGDADSIERALVADSSAAGRLHATRARAGLPDATAKAAAWRVITEPSSLGAPEIYAAAEGFFAADQLALTEPYVQRYFAEIGLTASFRAGWVLGETAGKAFPASHVEHRTLGAATALLGDAALAPPVRRAVVDRADRLRRALLSIERFS
ncbi:MAG: aminopeptidase N [Propionibacteriaceae bacterium]